MKRIITKKKTGDYCCPYCKEDIRKVGLCLGESGWHTISFSYDEDGSYKEESITDGNMESDGGYLCGSCGKELWVEDDDFDFSLNEQLPKHFHNSNI